MAECRVSECVSRELRMVERLWVLNREEAPRHHLVRRTPSSARGYGVFLFVLLRTTTSVFRVQGSLL